MSTQEAPKVRYFSCHSNRKGYCDVRHRTPLAALRHCMRLDGQARHHSADREWWPMAYQDYTIGSAGTSASYRPLTREEEDDMYAGFKPAPFKEVEP